MKRTTLVLEEPCMRAVRDLAHRESRDMSSLVNELLRDGLRRRRAQRPVKLELPVFAMGRPRVDLADRDQLEHAMEGT